MSMFTCIILGVLITVFYYFMVNFYQENIEDYNLTGTICCVIILTFATMGLSALIYKASTNNTQTIIEDYHRGKIEMVITTVQSGNNLIKQDTVYRYR